MVWELVHNGPFYTSMLVREGFKQYKEGVYLNRSANIYGAHAVKIVGYGYEKQPEKMTEVDDYYWIVANSWGTSFGE